MKKGLSLFLALVIFLTVGFSLLAQEDSPPQKSISASPEINPLPGLVPLTPTSVRLKAQDIKFNILGKGIRYKVEANYILSSQKAVMVPFGIPLAWMTCPDYWDCENPSQLTRAGKKHAKSIKIYLEGKQVTCALQGKKRNPKNPMEILGWCTGALEVPPGENISLSVKYQALMDYTFLTHEKLGTNGAGLRELNFPVVAFGNWAGKVDECKLEIDLGYFENIVKIDRPKPLEKKGHRYRWIFYDVNPLDPPYLVLSVVDEDHLKYLEIAHWNRTHHYNLKARASSENVSAGFLTHSAQNAIDGRTETAWCENAPHAGVGEWVKIRFRTEKARKKQENCDLKGFGVITGFTRDQASFESKNKVTKLEFYNCLDPTLGRKKVVIEAAEKNTSSAEVIPYTLPAFTKNIPPGREMDADCVYVKIAGVTHGRERNLSCITEIAPIILCD